MSFVLFIAFRYASLLLYWKLVASSAGQSLPCSSFSGVGGTEDKSMELCTEIYAGFVRVGLPVPWGCC